jgi:6-pyruvoyltetrahydropterin/6-carboxytetrahydropterin synthase
VELEGPLTEDSYVFDFVALKKLTRNISESLDHRFLLALHNPHLKIQQVDHHWEINYKESQYVFPEKDVKPLPIDNITVERLAEYIWGRFAEELPQIGGGHLNTLSVGVEEAAGQVAYYSAALTK